MTTVTDQVVDTVGTMAANQAMDTLTSTATDRASGLLSRYGARGVAGGIARVGLRAIPVVGLGLLAYDLGDLASRAITGKGLIDNASEKLFGKEASVAEATRPRPNSPSGRASLLRDAMAMTMASPLENLNPRSEGIEIG